MMGMVYSNDIDRKESLDVSLRVSVIKTAVPQRK